MAVIASWINDEVSHPVDEQHQPLPAKMRHAVTGVEPPARPRRQDRAPAGDGAQPTSPTARSTSRPSASPGCARTSTASARARRPRCRCWSETRARRRPWWDGRSSTASSSTHPAPAAGSSVATPTSGTGVEPRTPRGSRLASGLCSTHCGHAFVRAGPCCTLRARFCRWRTTRWWSASARPRRCRGPAAVGIPGDVFGGIFGGIFGTTDRPDQILPGEDGMDGFYYALLAKR